MSPGLKLQGEHKRSRLGGRMGEGSDLPSPLEGGLWGQNIVANSSKLTDGHFGINIEKRQASGMTDPPYLCQLTGCLRNLSSGTPERWTRPRVTMTLRPISVSVSRSVKTNLCAVPYIASESEPPRPKATLL